MAIVGLWWAYFVGDDEVAAEHFAAADPDQQSWMARMGYDLTHLLMIAGVIGVAAGTRLGLDDLWAPAERAAAWLIGGGAAVYLAATALFRSVLRVGPISGRLVGTVVLLGTAGVGADLGHGGTVGRGRRRARVTLAPSKPGPVCVPSALRTDPHRPVAWESPAAYGH